MATELATAYISLVPSARGIKGNISKELGGAGRSAAGETEGAFNRASGRVGRTFSAMFRGVATGGALAIGGAFAGVAIGKELLSTGAELETWKLKAETVFEDSNATIQAWADRNAAVFGVTDDELAGMAASFGDLLKPMGFTSEQAATMAQDVVGLSGALSEWTGGQRSASEVSDILAKAMLGERESLKELGISITEADVQRRLAEKGQAGLTGAALEQAKAMATQELIFEKSKDAQKAFAEGGNEAMRAQNNLKSSLGEVKETLATALTPVLADVAKWAGEKLPVAIEYGKQAFAAIKEWWDTDGVKFREQAMAVFQRISGVISDVVAAVRDSWPEISATISEVVETVRVVIESFVTIATTIWDNFGNNILEFTRRAWGPMSEIVGGALNIIQGIFKTFAALFEGDWAAVWDGIRQIFTGFWDAFTNVPDMAMEYVRLAVGVFLEIIGSAFKAAWDAILERLQSFANGAIEKLVGIVEWVKALPGLIVEAAKGMWDGISDAFKDMLNQIITWWNDLSFPEFDIPKVHVPGTDHDIGGGTIGGWDLPNIPKLHEGGVFSSGKGEGLALLSDGERVLTPAQNESWERGGAGLTVQGDLVVSDKRLAVDLDLWSQRHAARARWGAA